VPRADRSSAISRSTHRTQRAAPLIHASSRFDGRSRRSAARHRVLACAPAGDLRVASFRLAPPWFMRRRMFGGALVAALRSIA
jgi:hypothetical protein